MLEVHYINIYSNSIAASHMTCAASLCDLSTSAHRRLRTRVVAVRFSVLHSVVLNKLVGSSSRPSNTKYYDRDSLIKLRPRPITLVLDELVTGSRVDLAATVLDDSDVVVGCITGLSCLQFQQQQQRQCPHQPQQQENDDYGNSHDNIFGEFADVSDFGGADAPANARALTCADSPDESAAISILVDFVENCSTDNLDLHGN